MVVTCPQCKAHLRIDDTRIPPQGARVRCPKCSTAIFVKPPTAEAKKETLDRTKVLIAHSESKLLREMEELVRAAGYTPILSQDGIEAIVKASKELPFVAVLDVALPKEYGFDVCRKLKEIEYTKDIKVILVASVYDKRRFRRPPASTYGADDIIEDHEVKELLIQKIESLKEGGKEADSGTVTSPPREGITKREIPKGFDSFISPTEKAIPTVTSPLSKVTVKAPPEKKPQTELRGEVTVGSTQGETPFPPERPPAVGGEVTVPSGEVTVGAPTEDEMEEKARRLVRTILSDIYFYNRKKFEEAIKNGTFYETFQEELKEGLKLYESRIPPEVRARADYFREETEAFIESKKIGMKF